MAAGSVLLPNLPTALPATLAFLQGRVIKQHRSQGAGTGTASAAQQHEICLSTALSGDKKQALSEEIIAPYRPLSRHDPSSRHDWKPGVLSHPAVSEGSLQCPGPERAQGSWHVQKGPRASCQRPPRLSSSGQAGTGS